MSRCLASLLIFLCIPLLADFHPSSPSHPNTGGPIRGIDSRVTPVAESDSRASASASVPIGSDQLKMRFTENRGQIVDSEGKARPDVLYTADAGGAALFLTRTGLSSVFVRREGVPADGSTEANPAGPSPAEPSIDEGAGASMSIQRVSMTLVGCNSDAVVVADVRLPGSENFYLAHCPKGITGVGSYGEVTYRNMYDRIDLVYHASPPAEFKYEFVVHPGGDPTRIRMRFEGADGLSIDTNGDLHIRTRLGELIHRAPYTFTGDETPVASSYTIRGNEVLFALGAYDRTETLTIDPWGLHIGGVSNESLTDLAVSGANEVAFTGNTASVNFPVLNGYQPSYAGGGSDFIIGKMSASGALLWATYLGGSGSDGSRALEFDAMGNLLVIGQTSSADFPLLNAAQPLSGGGTEIAVAKLSASGTLLWSTFYGGSGGETPGTICVDGGGDVAFTGQTSSQNFPVTNAFQPVYGKNADGFIVKLSAGGSIVWATYLGGDKNDGGSCIGADPSGNLYVAGTTSSKNFPVYRAWRDTLTLNSTDMFFSKWTPDGGMIWSTYFGGRGGENPNDLCVGPSGSCTAVGSSNSIDFPVLKWIQKDVAGGEGAIVRFDSSGVLECATLLGGNASDFLNAVDVDAQGNILIAGQTTSINFEVANALQPVKSYGSNADAVFGSLSYSFADGYQRVWMTYFGTTASEGAQGIVVDANGDVTIGGSTAGNFLIQYPWFSNGNTSRVSDIYLLQLSPTAIPAAPSNLTAVPVGGTRVQLSWADNSDNEIAFLIERKTGAGSWQAAATVSMDETAYLVKGLTPSISHEFRILASTGIRTSPYANIAQASTGPFEAPQNLAIAPTSLSSATLSWQDRTSSEAGFLIESRIQSGLWSVADTAWENATARTVANLLPSTQYDFRLLAFDADIHSDYSGIVSITTKKVLGTPSDFQASVKSLTEAQLNWTDNATQESGYEVEQRTPNTPWSLVHTTTANATEYLRSGLQLDSTYIFRIRAVAIDALSEWSEERSVVMAYKPAVPASLAATAVDHQSIRLSWQRGSTNEKSYEIERRTGQGPWVPALTAARGDETAVDNGLASATSYSYRVRAVNDAGASEWSNEASASTIAMPPPGVPFALVAVATGPTSIHLTWIGAVPALEAGFELEESLTGNAGEFAPVKPDAAAGTAAYDRRGLLPETRYFYRMRAFNAGGRSAYSSVVDATTPREIPIPPLAPHSLTATTLDLTRIRIDWQIVDTIVVDRFELQRSPTGSPNDFVSLQPDPAGADRSFTDIGLSENTLYYYRLRAVNKFGISPWTDTTSARTLKRVIPPMLLAAMGKKDSIIALVEDILSPGSLKMDTLRTLLGDYAYGLDEQPAKDLIATWRLLGVADGVKSADAMDRYALFESAILDFSGSAVAQEVARQASLALSIAVKDLAALAQAWKGERPKATDAMKPSLDAAMQNLALSLYDGTRTLNALAGLDEGAELAGYYTGILASQGDTTGISSSLFTSFTPYHKERAFSRLFLPAIQPLIASYAGKTERLELAGRTDSARAKVKRLVDGAKARVSALASSFSSYAGICTALDASYTLSTAAGPELKTFFRRVSLFKDGFLIPLGRAIENAAVPAARANCLISPADGLPADLNRAGQAAFDPASVTGFAPTRLPDILPSFRKQENAPLADPAFADDRTLLATVRDRMLAVDTLGIDMLLPGIHAGGLSVIAAIDRLQRPLIAIDPADVLADPAFAALYYPAVGQAQRAKSIRAALLIPLLDYRLDPLPARQTAIVAEIDSVLAVMDRTQIALDDARTAAGTRLAVPAPVLDAATLLAIDTIRYRLSLVVRNSGSAPVTSCALRVTPLTEGVTLQSPGDITQVDIPAAGVAARTVECTIPAGLKRATFAIQTAIDSGAVYVDLCHPNVQPITAVDHPAYAPIAVTLEQNYPNPFNPSTTIAFSIPKQMSVRLSVHDVLGREIAVLADATIPSGKHERQWTPGISAPSGMYALRLLARDRDGRETLLQRRMLLAK